MIGNLRNSEMRSYEVDAQADAQLNQAMLQQFAFEPAHQSLSSRLRDWYAHVDKVEFWAGVVILGWYMAHCVLGLV